ncbi:LuxR C-terminal-related transcriptional regulator [Dactylosporangium sp. NPDC051541]|uniref:response regulator transcription factor n=1 Tax=Dactylosporangium sp. NPDC051541 TaxID=3363977 RepID=UPI0037981277
MRVVIAEDTALMREGLTALVERFGHEVTAAVADADELRRAAAALTPDVVITDIRMPPDNTDDGFRAAQAIRASHPATGILMLSQFLGDSYATRLLREPAPGGVGYLLKDRVGRVADFMHSLELVAAGGVVIDPKVIQRSIDTGRPGTLAVLSTREREVLARMAAGDTNQQIAEALHVSDGAVVKHIGNIFAKLGVQPEDGNRRVLAVLTYLRSTAPDPS